MVGGSAGTGRERGEEGGEERPGMGGGRKGAKCLRGQGQTTRQSMMTVDSMVHAGGVDLLSTTAVRSLQNVMVMLLFISTLTHNTIGMQRNLWQIYTTPLLGPSSRTIFII